MDGRVFAWGMAFEDRAEVVGADERSKVSFSSADSAHLVFSHCGKMRSVWFDPGAAAPSDQAA